MLTTEDRSAITDLINLHGLLTDRGDFEGLHAVFTEGITYDVSALGGSVLVGLAAIREAAVSLGEANPVAHHVTNIVITDAENGTAHAYSKGIGIMTDGSVGSATYDDTLERTTLGWRIAHRIVRPRRVPLQP
ncbi:nuclear transport factor 2 family protein [Nocardia beijingensis]|uniref:nuclear transport factor 2 family protein n=1 Tax=Nocardia beijingensis TaxID=95162 RepID=UPI001894C2E8|nr:nuclear transport factor 2 family protein [Nocardia beijingensis]MBF6465151.1 nuclear transport factor 2 family protein [Nocardia beijingensis]